MTDVSEEISSQVNDVVRRHLRFFEGDSVPLTEDLAGLGLDSLRAINLLLDLEETFALMFPDEMLTAETFKTRSSLERAIAVLKG
jgi:acyl carrier protein